MAATIMAAASYTTDGDTITRNDYFRFKQSKKQPKLRARTGKFWTLLDGKHRALFDNSSPGA